MPADDDERSGEEPRGLLGFRAFWTSLPGLLTGVATLVTAVATLAALNSGDGGSGGTSAGLATRSASGATPASGEEGCLRRYFAGIPPHRIQPVEAGTHDFDVITADQPKAGTIGLKLTNNNNPIGAIRIAFFPPNTLFKIESIVDERCKPIGDYSNVARGGPKSVLQNWDTVRLRLGGNFYDLRIGASTTIRLNFEAYAP
jgi:hypothetical protein